MSDFDHRAVERAAAGRTLRLPRGPHRGRLGEVRASSVGSSMELHDFRTWYPGDDLRHIDWNAVARTGEMVLRVRQDEVSPRVEVVLDASASMGVSVAKAARARELAAWVCTLARHGGLEPTLLVVGAEARKAGGPAVMTLASATQMAGREAFDQALARAPQLMPCGLRVVVSDFLFEAQPGPFAERLARGASGLALLQVVDPEDLEPSGGAGARLIDAESGEALDRLLTAPVLEAYAARLNAHVGLWVAAATRVRAAWAQVSCEFDLESLARRELVVLVDVAGGGP
jgi:hypothetical protein